MFWELLGLNWHDLNRLPVLVFEGYAKELEKVQRDRVREARRAEA